MRRGGSMKSELNKMISLEELEQLEKKARDRVFIAKYYQMADKIEEYEVNVLELKQEVNRLKGLLKPDTPFDPEMTLAEVEKEHILNMVKYYKGEKMQAAEALGITIKTLYNMLHAYSKL